MAVLWYGARLVIDRQISAGQLSAFVVFAIFVSSEQTIVACTFQFGHSTLMVCFQAAASLEPLGSLMN
jgi:ABC-type bacteriocin/lantibiotic exporter with double-glycine peptidase domain